MSENSVGLIPVLYGKEGLAPDTMRSYWRDVHGVFVSGHLGPSSYRQVHFDTYAPEFWSSEAVERSLPRGKQISGIAEFIFPSKQRRGAWENSVGPFADSDDGNVFSRSAAYTVSSGGFRDLKRSEEQPEFDEKSVRMIAMLQAREPGGDFQRYLVDVLAPGIARSQSVTDVHVVSLDPYRVPDWLDANPGGADRSLKADEQHHAIIEIVFASEDRRIEFFSGDFADLEGEFSDRISVIHAYRAIGAYTLISGSNVTMSGWLGSNSARLVRETDAANVRAALANHNLSRRDA